MSGPQGDGWTDEGGDNDWSKTLPGRAGESDLALAVFPDEDDPDEPWTWDVVLVDDDFFEIAAGGAKTADEAKAKAETAARSYLETGRRPP